MSTGITGSDLPGVPSSLGVSPDKRQPTNTNQVGSTNYRFFLHRAPAVTYFCQSVILPGVDIDALEQETFFASVKQPGYKPNFSDFTIKFLIDEDLQNWREIYDWMKSYSGFEDFDGFTSPEADHFSDATLMILTSGMNANLEVTFKNCFPTSLGSIEFDSSIDDIEALTTDITFAFDSYSINKL
jgi:hypothetical protein